MDAVRKALWLIESRLHDDLDLGEVAHVCGVSPFHLSRLFAAATGHPLIGYARRRRMSVAAARLARGEASVTALAFDHGYGSPEAFSRAFRKTLGAPPGHVRRRGHLDGLDRQEPIAMQETPRIDIEAPRFETRPASVVVGLAERYEAGAIEGIPAQWGRFQPYIGHVPGQVGDEAYGVCRARADGGIDYVCAVRVRPDADDPPPELARVELPAGRYAVFRHRAHVSSLKETVRAIWGVWLPASGHQALDAPDFELYDDRFDPRTGEGEVEIWLPLRG